MPRIEDGHIVDCLPTRKGGRIQIVSEIEAHWAHRSLVSHPDSDGVRDVVVVTLAGGGLLQTEPWAFLAPAQQVVEHVMPVGKDVSGIMEDGKAHVFLEKGQGRRRSAELDIIHEQRCSAQGKAGLRITRSRLIQSESTMRVSASGKETFGQWKTRPLPGLRRVALFSRLRHESPSEWGFDPDAGGASQNKLPLPVLAE